MRNVVRPAKPGSLKRNATRWKRELRQGIKEHKRQGTRVPRRFYDRYKKADVKDALKSMYNCLCCYCEIRTRGGQIEHRKPKNRFPEDAFEWDNLHLVCAQCNQAKGAKYSLEDEILDAVNDNPISDHLTYKYDRRGVRRRSKTDRGATTVKHADLNREELRSARTQVLLEVMQLITEINSDRCGPGVEETNQQLKDMCKDEYGSLIEYAMGTCLRPN